MRPVVLEMNGFAAFREPITVDFTGAEYFALVGPTGSGKSTVIDAMTFALYGSVPRWDDRRMVALALAPSVNRGTVQLVFDASGARYVVVRELRRAASGAVNVRNARLERLVSADDEETELLAADSGVTKRVEQLLGLPFDQFCMCVVLPQGEFAEFLHAKPSDRQLILTRLLGLGVYERIAKEANSEAAGHRQRAELLTEQLGGYADVTEDAARAAGFRVTRLEALAERVAALLPDLAAAVAAVESADALLARLRVERAQLAAVTLPAGLAELDDRQRGAAADADAARARLDAAEAADTAARRQVAAAPARSPLEQALRDHAELAATLAEQPGAHQRLADAVAADEEAAAAARQSRAELAATRATYDAAAAAAVAAQEAGRWLGEERERLAALRAPAGLAELGRRQLAATAGLDAAVTRLAAAEAVDGQTRERLRAAPARGPLEQARLDHAALADALDAVPNAQERHAKAVSGRTAAGGAVGTAAEHVAPARARREQAARADLVAALRPSLVAGEPCPVCMQEVAALPAPLPGRDLAALDAAVAAAEAALERARRAESDAVAGERQAAADRDRLVAEIARLRAALADRPPTAEAVVEQLAALDDLARAAEAADEALRTARRARADAADAADTVRVEVAAAEVALNVARDPLVALGAPAVDTARRAGGGAGVDTVRSGGAGIDTERGDGARIDPAGSAGGAPTDTDVAAGWAALLEWAAAEGAAREAALSGVRDRASTTEADLVAAAAALERAEQAAEARRRGETAAARAEQQARGRREALDERVTQLRAALAAAPDIEVAQAGLARRDQAEETARRADVELQAARAARAGAAEAVAVVSRDVAAVWEGLRATRDPLVPLGAPAVAGDDLLAAWAGLTAWVAREIAARDGQVPDAPDALAAARRIHEQTQRRLADALAEHGVEVRPAGATGDVATAGAPEAAVAAALERARAARDRLVERRAEADKLRADRAAAESAQQVARLLGNLLRSDGFPRWLVASALDALVADASTSLAELSGGQFELTHHGGEFLVVDHTDADARRPVKTLSGGETFQASLALALALSAQLSTLAAEGAARLDSIFLDEGFGTLDEANLDVVAGTLENLAARGDRMVGVVTHVPALAERVPVRFVVSRDQQTSSVVRESS